MKGGLLQLATVGKADSILINKPQMFHFKKVYMKYTNFSIDNNSQVIGEKKFDTNFEINLRKNGDLLKDIFFYLEIPYFNIFKKVNKKISKFIRMESDKLYYDYLDMKAFIYYTGNDQYYIIPENVLYINSKKKENNLDTLNIISINSSEYSLYYNNNSKFKEIMFDEKIKHPIIPFIKAVDSTWFNNLINNTSKKDFQITLMDQNLFSNWITDKVDNRLFLNYHNLFNLNQFKNEYQINFDGTNNNKTNEIKKYFEILGQMDNLDKTTYISNRLDIDNAMNLVFTNNEFELGSDELIEYLENTILYSSRFIQYILNKLYDDNIGNYFTFYNMYSTAYTTDNGVISKNNRNYDNTVWDNYINNGFIANFDSKSSVLFKSGFWDKFITTSNLIEKDINNMWNSINLDFDNIEFIYSVIYTFVVRYESFSSFNTINFLDFFEKEGETGFFKTLKINYGNYSNITKTDLTNNYNNYGQKFDLTLIYNYLVYSIAYRLSELKKFESFNNINKQNIQFIYWWRNKIANMIFLRYKRIQGKTPTSGNFYPDFTNIKETNELINMFYTFIPNNIVSLTEIKNDLYRLFNNNSYMGVSTNDTNGSGSFRPLSKVTEISNQNYDKNYTGTIDAQYNVNVLLGEFIKSGRVISFISSSNKIRRSYFDKRFKLELFYSNNYYPVTSNYSNGQTTLILDTDMELIGDFKILVTLYMPINKYYIDYSPLEFSKTNLTFDTSDDRIFTFDKYINTDKFNFILETAPQEINSNINIHTNTINTSDIQHNFYLKDFHYLSEDLFSSSNISNYNIKVYQEKNYTNPVNTDNFSISSSTINDVLYNVLTINSTTADYFTNNTNYIYYVYYNQTNYLITLSYIEGSTTSYIIESNSLTLGLLNSVTQQDYYLIEYSPVVSSVSLFSLTRDAEIDLASSDVTNIDNTTMSFTYTGSETIQSGTTNYNLLYQNNKYYHVSITYNSGTSKYYVETTETDIVLDGATIFTGYNISFSDSTTISKSTNSSKHYINYVKTSENVTTENIKIKPVLTNGSNFISSDNKFKYQLESLENSSYTELITNDSISFNIEGRVKYNNNTRLFYRNLDTTTNKYIILENKFINNNLLRITFDNNSNYFLKIVYLNSSQEKKRIVFNKTKSLNEIYFFKESKNIYLLDLNLDNIAEIYLETIPFVYEEFILSGKIIVETTRVNNLKIRIDSNANNLEQYYKFVKYGNNTYYINNETRIINLGYPVAATENIIENGNNVEATFITFKILNPEGEFTTDTSDKDYKIRVFLNDYLPNLINYTSFYLLDNEDKSYDLMDYFIQTPMILYLDKSTTKNGNIILYNLPFDSNLMDELKYLKLDDEYFHLNEKINSNQILRYGTNLVSSSFDYDIISFDNSIYTGKENLIIDIETAITKELESYDINKIIDTIDNTNLKVIDLFQNNGLKNISDGVFGKTIEKLLTTFNNSNLMSLLNENNISIGNLISNITSKFNYNVIDSFDYEDFNLYSKMVIDFYGSDGGVSYDSHLNLSLNSSSGQSVFITNYKPLLLSNRLNVDMLDFLKNYKTEISNQLVYIKNNLLWYDIGSKNINNKFGYFYDFQQNYRNYIYNEKDGKNYNYKYLFNNHFDLFKDLGKKTFHGKDEIVMGESTINSSLELKPVRKTINGVIKENNNSIYKYKNNAFNYLGPGLVKDGVIINDSINYNFDSNKSYMFVDDISGCYKIISNNSQEFEINDKTNKFYKDSYVMEIANSNIDMSLVNYELYLYEFKKFNDQNDVSDNNYILIDNTVCKVTSTNYNNGNIGVISFYNLDLENTKYFKGTLKSNNFNYTDSSDILLVNNMVNLFDFSNNKLTLGELVNIKHFNKKTSNYDSQKIYCSEGDGILKIENIDSNDHIYITDEIIYELNNKVIEKKPMKLKNGIVSYHNISKDLTPDTYIYNEKTINQLKNMSDSTIPENIWFLNGELEEILIRLNTVIDINNKEINLSNLEFNELKSLYMYYNNNFYKINDFTATNIDYTGSINKSIFYIDNKVYDTLETPLEIISGRTYRFNNSHKSNIDYPFLFSTTDDGTHTGGGSNYPTDVAYYPNQNSQSQGNHQSYVEIQFPNNETTMYYYSSTQAGMGGVLNVTKGLVNFDVTVELGTNDYRTDGLVFYINNRIYNSTNPLLLEGNKKYRFNYSDSTNSGHPLQFSTTPDGTNNGGLEDSSNVTKVGTPGSTDSYIEIIVPTETNLYFYCANHSGMGGQCNINNDTIQFDVNVGTSPNVFILNENSFNISKEFYTYKVKNNDSITYNVMTNTTNSTSTELNNFEITEYRRYLVNNSMNYTHDVNLLFADISTTRPINVQVTDTNNKVNRLLYNVYSDSGFSSEIDSVYKIPESEIDSSNTLKNDSSFYLKFNLSSNTTITTGNLIEYYLNKEKVSYVNIEPDKNDIEVFKLDENGSQYQFKISSGTKLIKGDFNRFNFNVYFIYDNVNYNFSIIMRVIADNNYQQVLEMNYSGSYELLHEPYLITNPNNTPDVNKLKDSGNNIFIGCIPEIFIADTDNFTIIENNSVSLSNIKSYENNVTYMDIDIEPSDLYYKEVKMKEKISLNDKVNYWELIDKVVLYDNKITINETNKEIINKVNSIILFLNDRCYYVNIIEKKDSYILIDYKFDSFNNSAILYVNLFEGTKVDTNIFLNTKINILYSSFGEFRIGEIIEISHIKLLIKNYDLRYHGYTFDIITNYDIQHILPYYSGYYSLGLINNYNMKNKLVNLNQDNKLLSKKKDNINLGDFIVSNKNIGYYDNKDIIFYDDTLNYGFNHVGFDIKLTFLNNQWLYFGSDLGTDIKILAQYQVSGVSKSKILVIKYILNNIVFWKEDYTNILNNLTTKYKDGYFFYYPYQPFQVKYLQIENNCSVNFNGNGIIDIERNYYLIDGGNILNYDKKLKSNYYSVILLEETKTEFSDYSVDMYPFQKELFYDINFYRSNTIYYDGVDSSNIEIADIKFNKDSSYYYYDSILQKYKYPIYLIKTSKQQTSKIISDIPVYYHNLTTSDTQPDSNSNHLNFDEYINKSFYILDDSKYYYPLYLNVNILNSNKENNLLKNIKVDCNIINKPLRISFESKPNTVGYLGNQYSYNIITKPTNCKIIAINLPLWLTLNGEPGNYNLSGIPEINDTNNDINLIAEYNTSSTIQNFKINISETNTSLQFTSSPLTYIKTGEEYTYNVSATPNISSIKAVSLPLWLTLTNNKISGIPNNGNIGRNTIILEAIDSNDNKVNQEFDILVNNNYVPYITSKPPTTILPSTVYTYDISYNKNGNNNIDLLATILPDWLTLVGNSTLTGEAPSSNGEHLVVIKISENNIFSEQSFTIKVSNSNIIKFYSNPKTYGYINDEYVYPIMVSNSSNDSVIFEYDIVGINLPNWLSIDEHMNLRGVPGLCYLGENNIIIQATDTNGNTEKQTFSIYIIENQNKIIRLNNGVFENIIKNIHFDYNTKILINSSYYNLRNIVNYMKYSEIYVDEYVDLSGENIITFPINFSNSKKEIINDHYVNITNTNIGYTYHINETATDTDSKLFCYFTINDQLQIRTFDIKKFHDSKFTITDEDFSSFFNEFADSMDMFIENYYPINVTTVENSTYYYKILSFNITTTKNVLIEEKYNDEIFIHYAKLELKDGLLKIVNNISNNDSEFFINKLIPIRIRDNTVQIINPIVYQNLYYGINSRETVDNWVEIPVQFISKPLFENEKWKVEVNSKYMFMLDKYEVYDKIVIYKDSIKVSYKFINGKNYLFYNKIPKIDKDFVYVRKTDFFEYLTKSNNILKNEEELSGKGYNDTYLTRFLGNNWRLHNEKVIIPINITDGDITNHYIVDQNFKIENINLRLNNIEYYLDNENNKIISSGITNNNNIELKSSVKVSDTANSVNLYISTTRGNIITNDIFEVKPSINTILDVMENSSYIDKFNFNSCKTFEDWTSVTFNDNISYKNNKQNKLMHFSADSSGNVSTNDDTSGSLLLYEEFEIKSKLRKVIKLLSIDNFKNYNMLINIRKIEDIIFNYINSVSNNYSFWNDPIKNINSYLEKYNGKFNTKNYMIYKNCIVTKDEIDNKIINNTNLFENNNNNLVRIAYLDNQFTINKTSTLKVYRYKKQIKQVINKLINNIDLKFFGSNSHLVLQKISEIYLSKNNFIKNLKDGEKFNFKYDILTLEKLVISKQWENILDKNKEMYQLFNTEFNDKLSISYNKDPNYKIDDFYNGIIDSEFGSNPIGLDSYNKIIKNNFNQEELLFNTYPLNINNYTNREIIDYRLESNDLFKYQIRSSDDIIFKPEYNYKLQILEGDNVINDININVTSNYSNLLEFTLNEEYRDYNDISLLIEDNYSILNTEFIGYYYEDLTINDLSSGDIFMKVDYHDIIINSYETSTTNTKFNIISPILIKNDKYIKIEKLVGINKQEFKNINDEDRLYITFTKNFDKSNFKQVSDLLYIDINDSVYQIYSDSSGLNYISGRNELINKYINHKIFFYYQFNNIESSQSNNYIYNLELDKDLHNIGYKTSTPLNINYNVDNTDLSNIEIIDTNKIKVFIDTPLTSPKKLNNIFKLEKRNPILINSIDSSQNSYLIEILNDINILESNSSITLKRTGYSDITGTLYSYTNNNNFIFETDDFYTSTDLIDYETEIVNIINITTYEYSENILSFISESNITLNFNEYFKYYVDIGGSYYLVDNSCIYVDRNIIMLDLTNIGNITPTSTFNFKQVNQENKTTRPYKYNRLINVGLSKNFITKHNIPVTLKYLTNNNKEIGNYIYSFPKSDISVNLSYNYKLETSLNNSIDIFLIGEYNSRIYFSTVSNLSGGDYEYRFYSTNYNINKNIRRDDVRFQSNTHFNCIINKNIDTNNFNIGVEISKKQDLILFPNDSNNLVNLYIIPNYTKNSNLDLIMVSDKKYSFPEELDYKKYKTDLDIPELKTEEISWNEDFSKKIFSNIDIYFNDQRIDSMNENISKINDLYLDKNKRINNKPVLKDGKFYLYLPLVFWFNQSSSNYLPLIALENTLINLKVKINNFENLINNNLDNLISKIPNSLSIQMFTDTILLNSTERQNFAEYNHEYLIQRNVTFGNNLIRDTMKTISIPIKGLVKDIFWILKSKDTNKNYLSIETDDKDIYYLDFIETKEIYNKYINNNREFNNEISTSYKEKFNIMQNIYNLIDNYNGTGIVNIIKTNEILLNYDEDFILYIYFMYLSYYDKYNDSYFGTDIETINNNRIRIKLSKLFTYLKYTFKDTKKITKKSPIKKLDFKVNGRSLLAENNFRYYNTVLPYQKMNRTPDLGIGMYSFSLYPTLEQPSGELNFNILKNPTLELEMDELVKKENVFLNTVVREYQILRIISGVASLSWI